MHHELAQYENGRRQGVLHTEFWSGRHTLFYEETAPAAFYTIDGTIYIHLCQCHISSGISTRGNLIQYVPMDYDPPTV
jgi:hypothetical protein